MLKQLSLELRRKGRRVTIPPPSPDETSLHIAIADLLRWQSAPGWMWCHIPLGGERREATGRLLKRMGAKPGWPDFQLISPENRWHGLEIKTKGGRLSPDQLSFGAACDAYQRPYRVVWSFEQAEVCLREWKVLRG